MTSFHKQCGKGKRWGTSSGSTGKRPQGDLHMFPGGKAGPRRGRGVLQHSTAGGGGTAPLFSPWPLAPGSGWVTGPPRSVPAALTSMERMSEPVTEHRPRNAPESHMRRWSSCALTCGVNVDPASRSGPRVLPVFKLTDSFWLSFTG